MKKRLAIVGSSGFIGHHMSKFFLEVGNFELLMPSEAELNITEKENWLSFLLDKKPSFLILLAGSKNVKKLEEDSEFAYKINTQPVKDIVEIIRDNDLDTKFIFFSSDYVFDGKKGDYKASDEALPKTNYGKSKLEAERVLLYSNIDFKIIRTSAVMGEGGVFYEWLKKSLLSQQEINMFGNVYFTPTHIDFLNASILKIIDNFSNISDKIIHVVGDKKLSRYEFAIEMQKQLRSKAEIKSEEADISHSTFCNDLSMMMSDCVKG